MCTASWLIQPWIAVNELGVTLCLLNRYPDPHPAGRQTTSRGLIVLGMADAKGAAGPPCAAAGPMRLELARRSDAAA
jgi:hypothetical protein